MTLARILSADARWSQALRRAEQPGLLHLGATLFAHSGDSWFWALGLALVAWRGDAASRAWAWHIFLAVAALAVLVMALKLLIRRRRPAGEWGAIYRNTDPHSFPSGHAARTAMLAVLLCAWGPAWAAPIAVVWAPLVSVARVSLGVHYLSDVVAGALLGLIAAGVAVAIGGA
ncbi:MAG: phosphatase PAP2 family protein [Anaerolineales bacterium]|nr:phosphatase PAP2 family protein [Anaerolineales bacterium]